MGGTGSTADQNGCGAKGDPLRRLGGPYEQHQDAMRLEVPAHNDHPVRLESTCRRAGLSFFVLFDGDVLFERATTYPLCGLVFLFGPVFSLSLFFFVRFPASLSADPEVAQEVAVDPLAVKGSVRNKTAFEFIKLMEASKESAGKVCCCDVYLRACMLAVWACA